MFLGFGNRVPNEGHRVGMANVRLWQILLQKSAATDLAVGLFVKSRALKRWP